MIVHDLLRISNFLITAVIVHDLLRISNFLITAAIVHDFLRISNFLITAVFVHDLLRISDFRNRNLIFIGFRKLLTKEMGFGKLSHRNGGKFGFGC